MSIKLPKQFAHWLQCANLKTEGRRYSGHLFYFRGRNRHFRIDRHGHLEASCPNEHFDRWANSRGAELLDIPKTRDQFILAIKWLVDQSKDAR